jgi:hypothetical protein
MYFRYYINHYRSVMKKQLLSFLLLAICLAASSQVEVNKSEIQATKHIAGDFIISAAPNLMFNTPNGSVMAGGVKMQVFMGKKFSFDSDIVFGRDYCHFGPGVIGLPVAMIVLAKMDKNQDVSLKDEDGSFTTFLFLAAAVALSVEHFSCHFPVKNNMDISPYISLLRYKIAYKYGTYSDPDIIGEQFSFASGIQLNKYIGRFVFAPYAEYNVGYKDHISGFNIGAYCGFLFHTK